MDDLSQTAREQLRRYQRGAGLAPEARARVWGKIDESLEAAVVEVPRSPRRRSSVVVVSMITAVAAAVVFAVCDLRRGMDATRRVEVDAASHEVVPEDARGVEVRTSEVSVVSAPVVVEAPRVQRGVTPVVAPERGLAIEVGYMRDARAAIDGGDPAAALVVLGRHAREFVDGQMLEDRLRLRIEALCGLGRGDEARAEADEFLRVHPNSTHTARVRGLCRGHE